LTRAPTIEALLDSLAWFSIYLEILHILESAIANTRSIMVYQPEIFVTQSFKHQSTRLYSNIWFFFFRPPWKLTCIFPFVSFFCGQKLLWFDLISLNYNVLCLMFYRLRWIATERMIFIYFFLCFHTELSCKRIEKH
jgi:hypothetical protein